MKVWVIMGNDFPDGVASSEEKAKEHIKKAKADWEKKHPESRMIYWRSYEYELDGGLEE